MGMAGVFYHPLFIFLFTNLPTDGSAGQPVWAPTILPSVLSTALGDMYESAYTHA